MQRYYFERFQFHFFSRYNFLEKSAEVNCAFLRIFAPILEVRDIDGTPCVCPHMYIKAMNKRENAYDYRKSDWISNLHGVCMALIQMHARGVPSISACDRRGPTPRVESRESIWNARVAFIYYHFGVPSLLSK